MGIPTRKTKLKYTKVKLKYTKVKLKYTNIDFPRLETLNI